jgi:hypothetical protein
MSAVCPIPDAHIGATACADATVLCSTVVEDVGRGPDDLLILFNVNPKRLKTLSMLATSIRVCPSMSGLLVMAVPIRT